MIIRAFQVFLVVYNLEAVLMDLYITFFWLLFFTSARVFSGRVWFSVPSRGLGLKLAQIKHLSVMLRDTRVFRLNIWNSGSWLIKTRFRADLARLR